MPALLDFLAYSCITVISASIVTLSSHCLLPLPHAYKDFCDYTIEPTWIIQGNGISTSLTILSPFCHTMYHIHRFWGLGHRHHRGDIILTTTPTILTLKSNLYYVFGFLGLL